MQKIYTAQQVFNGREFLRDHAVVVKDGFITEILPVDWLPGNLETTHGHYLVPSFIDLQIYGARKKLFSAYPSADTLDLMYAHCLRGGTAQFQPTIATNSQEVMRLSIDAVKNYRQLGGKGVIGLHLEGPWINPQKSGAHIKAFIEIPTIKGVTQLLEYGEGNISMITLAPEVCSQEIIDLIHSYNITISAGHSNAGFKEASSAFNSGITTVTHLYNAMSTFHHRETGLPGAVFQHPSVMASIIADGEHVDFAAIKIAKELMWERLFLITDAVTETTEGPYQHMADGNKFTSGGILSGSSLTMLQAVKNCIEKAGIDNREAFRMASLYPARAKGLSGGLIEIGTEASFLLLDEGYTLLQVGS